MSSNNTNPPVPFPVGPPRFAPPPGFPLPSAPPPPHNNTTPSATAPPTTTTSAAESDDLDDFADIDVIFYGIREDIGDLLSSLQQYAQKRSDEGLCLDL